MNELYSAEFWQQCPTPAAAAAVGLFYSHGASSGGGASDASAPYFNAAFPNLHHIHNTFFGPSTGSAPFPNSLQSLGLGAATVAAAREPPPPYPTLNLFNSQQQQIQQQHVQHRIQQQQHQQQDSGGNNNNHRHAHHEYRHQQQQQQLLAPSTFGGMLAADLLDLGHQNSRQAAAAIKLKPAFKADTSADDRKRVLSGQENQNNNNTGVVGGFLWARNNNNNNNNSDIPAGDHISAESLKPITIPFVSCPKSETGSGIILSPSNHFHHFGSGSNDKHGDDSGGASTLAAQTCQACLCAQSNGLHFGAKTCAACAAFFRRSVSDNKVYQCKRSQRCVIKPGDTNGYRKICRACRMQRCLEIGMQSANVQNKHHRRDFYFGDGFTLADGSGVLPHPIPIVRPHLQQQQENQRQHRQHGHTHNNTFSPLSHQPQRVYGNVSGANNTVLNSIFTRINPAAAAATTNASLFLATQPIPFSVGGDDLRCPNTNTVINHGVHELLQHHGGTIAPADAASSALFEDALDRRLFGRADELMDLEANKPMPTKPTVGYGKPDNPTATVASRQGSVIIAPTHFPHVGKDGDDVKRSDIAIKELALPDYCRQHNDEGMTISSLAPKCSSNRTTGAQPINTVLAETECRKPNDAEIVGNGFYGGTMARESTLLRISSMSMLDAGVSAENYAALQAPPVTSSWLTPNVSHQIAIENS